MGEHTDQDDELGQTRIGILKEKAKRSRSKEDFLKILTGISEICSTDEEAQKRRVVHFIDVVEEFIKYELVDVPEDQDWSWAARLFLIGAFEN
jgi:hypothetical protein